MALPPNDPSPPAYDDFVNTYELTILQEIGDWSLANGDIALTKDGDFKVGDNAYNALFRLVQTWRYSAPHMRYLFETMYEMLAKYDILNDKIDGLATDRAARFSPDTYGKADAAFVEDAAGLNAIWEEQAVATFGAATYGGCLMLILSSALLRFKDDIDVKSTWETAEPLFNTYSLGSLIVAAANGYRHADEWAKAGNLDRRQARSQDAINGALVGCPEPAEISPGRCVEVLSLIGGGNFDSLTARVFAFAHNLALGVRNSGT